MRYLIVNGDDCGLSPGVTRGILEAHQVGVLTSTSLMVCRPAAAEAAALAREAPALSVGLHLELEGPAAEAPRDALSEQLRRFEQLMGRPPSHLDSHHDAHRDPRALPDVLEWGGRLGIPVRAHSPVACFGEFYGEWSGESHPEQVGVENLLTMLETGVPPGITELICHPGYVDPDLDSSYREVREIEVATLCDLRVRESLKRGGVRLIGFRDVPGILADSTDRRQS